MNPTKSSMKLLFDTNAFYASEDISRDHQHADATDATRLREVAIHHNCQLMLHPATKKDIDRTTDRALREASSLKMRQWKILERPHERPELASEARYLQPISDNDAVDLGMIAALDTNAVDYLITQDKRLRAHAMNARLGDRVLSIKGGIEYLERLFGETVSFPTVERRKAYELSETDPIFNSLRTDYPEFDEWFAKVRNDHRECLVIGGSIDDLEALAILKEEIDRPYDLAGKILKVCTLKVAEQAGGAKRGELLLKSILQIAAEDDVDSLYVEVLPAHKGIVNLLETFGFRDIGFRTPRDELVLIKSRRPNSDDVNLGPLEYHRRFGPPAVLVKSVFIVPIQPRWHDALFPEGRKQQVLFSPDASGNAILKAYLTESAITTLGVGALLLFYRSHDQRAVTAIGVVDGLLRSRDPSAIREFVGLRTVYTDEEISKKCRNQKGALAIKFRQDRLLASPWKLNQLISYGFLKAAPQTIQQITKKEALEWFRSQLNAPH